MPKNKSLIQQALDEPCPVVYGFPESPKPFTDLPAVVLTFPPPTKPESFNQTAGKHWASSSVAKSKWVNAAVRVCLERADELAVFRGHRVQITVAVPFPDRRRRDGHNYTPTVAKPLIDGMVRSGALVPDDNTTWVECLDPVLYFGELVRVRIRVASPSENPEQW